MTVDTMIRTEIDDIRTSLASVLTEFQAAAQQRTPPSDRKLAKLASDLERLSAECADVAASLRSFIA